MMIARFFSPHPRPEAFVPRVPAGRRIYAIGDIHGRADALDTMHGLVREDAAQHADRSKAVVYLGDYVDRGPDSRAVIDILRDPPLDGFEIVRLLGNHEDTLLDFLDDETVGPNWLAFGGASTLFSYGVRPPNPPTDEAELLRARHELARNIPPEHVDFLNKLVVSHTEGDYVFVHAGLVPNVPFDRQSVQDMLWIRDEFLRSSADFGKIVIHGHSITDEPDIRANRIGIDTGAYATGRLTCLVLDGANRAFLAT